MLRLFRYIREEILVTKKSRQYLSYAIGEQVLVVFGILIALQINNWNEERIEQRQIADYAHSLIQDLAAKISAYEAFTHHLEGDYDFDRTVGIKAD